MSELPTMAQVLELVPTSTLRVLDSQIDENGHMNVLYYFKSASEALKKACDQVGFGSDYIATRGLTSFSAEHHLRYFSELRLNEKFSLHIQFLGRSPKTIHAMVYLVNRSREQIAATFEAALVHVSMSSRRAVEIPDDIGRALDDLIRAHAMTWSPPACGVMGARRR